MISLGEPSARMVLITGRTIAQGKTGEAGKLKQEYLESVAQVELDRGDFEGLGLSSGDNVRVKTAHGEVIVRAVESRFKHPGIAFMPMGPWANLVVDPSSQGSGMPTFKGVEVKIASSSEPIASVQELLRDHYGGSVQVPGLEVAPKRPNEAAAEGERVFESAVCPFCGCLCDDIEVKVSQGKIAEAKRACAIGSSKFLDYMEERIEQPMVKAAGGLLQVSLGEAVERAAQILSDSKYPLLYGWSSTSNDAMRVGFELAELLGGVMDNTTSVCHGPTILGVQGAGTVKATLGQIRNRADMIIYWGSNPLNAHLRHLLRYSAMARGVYVKSRAERKVVVVDVRETPTSKVADLFIRVDPNRDFELISALRMAVRDHDIEAEKVAGVPRQKIYELADMMRSTKYGVVFFGLGVTMTAGRGRTVENLIRLVQELNDWTKFVLQPMRGHFNVTGACATSLWLTGYAYGVDYMRGYPRHNPNITSTSDLLANGDVDAALIVASDPVSHLPRKAVENLLKIPLIVIDPRWSMTAAVADVVIPSAFVGIEAEGTGYRMDGVPLRLKKIVEPPPSVLGDELVLQEMLKEVERLRGV